MFASVKYNYLAPRDFLERMLLSSCCSSTEVVLSCFNRPRKRLTGSFVSRYSEVIASLSDVHLCIASAPALLIDPLPYP